MVADHLSDDVVDRIFQALADRTRRDIVRRVIEQEQSVSRLSDDYAMSFAAVQKHVAVLERAGLVTKERRGREQIVRGDVGTIRQAGLVLERYEHLWRERVRRVDDLLAEAD
jgi:DNA-binding transcriptional ArsR family regulator